MIIFNKKGIIIVITLILIFTVACTSQGEEASTKEKTGQVNKALSMKLSLEHGVLAGQIFLNNGIATAKIIAESNLEKNKLEEIVQKYVEILRESYGNKAINIQGIQNNETIIDLFIEQ